MKETILISFSGGRTSAYMAKYIVDNMSKRYNLVTVFANTGKERNETLDFVDRCDKEFGLNVVWIEAVIQQGMGNGIRAKVVDYSTADRKGKVFESHIAKYGISNVATSMCTRDMKNYAIHSYMKQSGYLDYYTAIGIRADEFDRINPNHKKLKYIYPLVSIKPTTRFDVNKFWIEQSFDLNLKSYEGNCDVCFKKSLRKILTLAKERPDLFKWWSDMEDKYGNFIPKTRNKNNITFPIHFNRNNISIKEILKASISFSDVVRDDSKDVQYYKQLELWGSSLDESNGCSESCEVF